MLPTTMYNIINVVLVVFFDNKSFFSDFSNFFFCQSTLVIKTREVDGVCKRVNEVRVF